MRRGAQQFRDDFVQSLSFQMVIVPSALALIGLIFGDWMGKPALATVLTVALAVGFFVFYWYVWSLRRRERRKRSMVDASEASRSYRVVVFTPSILREKGDASYWDQIERICNAWKPHEVGCIISRASEDTGGMAIVREVMKARAITLSEFRLPEMDDHLRPLTILRFARSAIEQASSPHDVLVDITAGTSVMSVGLYEAAMESNANVGYIDQMTIPRLILESDPIVEPI